MFNSRLFLTFKDQEYAKEYYNTLEKQRKDSLQLISIFLVMVSSIATTLAWKKYNNSAIALFVSYCCIWICVFLWSFMKRCGKLWNSVCAILQAGFACLIVEIVLSEKGQQELVEQDELLLIFIMINSWCSYQLQNHWMSRSLIVLVQIEYFIFRLFYYQETFSILLHLTLGIIVVLSYSLDRNQKLIFILKQNQLKASQEWTTLLDSFLPIQMLIISSSSSSSQKNLKKEDMQVVYSNKRVLDLLDIKQSADILQSVQNLQFPTNIQNSFSFKKSKSFQEQKNSLPKNLLDKVLYDLQSPSSESEDKQKNYKCQKGLDGETSKVINESYFNLKYKDEKGTIKKVFDVKQISCNWKNKRSVILLMSEAGEKEQQMRAKEVDRFKNRVIDSITHNLKTPLNGILLSCQTLQMNLHDPENLLILDQVYYNSFLLLNMVNDILDYSRLLKDKLILDIKDHFIGSILEEVFSIMKIQFDVKKLSFFIRDYTKNSLIKTDKNRLIQVLLQFLSNSLKYTSSGVVILQVKLKDTRIEFLIEDTGQGMSKQLIQKLGNLFLEPMTSYQHGVGLGFIISKHLLDKIYPENLLKVISTENKGTKVVFLLQNSLGQPLLQTPRKGEQRDLAQPKDSIQTDQFPLTGICEQLFNSEIIDEALPQIKKNSLFSIASQRLKSNFQETEETQKENAKKQMPFMAINQDQLDFIEEHPFLNSEQQNIFFTPEIQIPSQKDINNPCDQSHFLYGEPLQQDKALQQLQIQQVFYRKSSFFQASYRPTLLSLENSLTLNKFQLSPHPQLKQKEISQPNSNYKDSEYLSLTRNKSMTDSLSPNPKQISGFNFSSKKQKKQFSYPLILPKQDEQLDLAGPLSSKVGSPCRSNQNNDSSLASPILVHKQQPIISKNGELQIDLTSSSSSSSSSPSSSGLPSHSSLQSKQNNQISSIQEEEEQGAIEENVLPVMIYPPSEFKINNIQENHQNTSLFNSQKSQENQKKVNFIRTQSIDEHLITVPIQTTFTEEVEEKVNNFSVPKIFPTSSNSSKCLLTHVLLPFSSRQTKCTISSQPIISNKICSQELISNKQSLIHSAQLLSLQQSSENQKINENVTQQLNYNNIQEILFESNWDQEDKIEEVPSSNEGTGSNQNIHSALKISKIATHEDILQTSDLFLPQQFEVSLGIQQILENKVKKILIVDDNPFNILCLKALFKKFNFLSLIEAHDGKDALEKVQKENFDLILMDVNMPVMDGLEATYKIKELINDKQIPPTKIFIVTAFGDSQNKEKAFSIGADAHITKPITLNSLYHELKINFDPIQN